MASTFRTILLFGAVIVEIASCADQIPATGTPHKIPRQATFSNSTSLTPTPTPTATSCVNDCSVCASAPYTFYWEPYSFTDTFVAATVVEVINTAAGTTKTSTIFNELPDGYTNPPTNAAGTQTHLLTYTRSGKETTTNIAFPTEFMQWADGYSWAGTLSTEAAGADASTCVVASTSTYVPFASYPQPPVTMITRADGIPDPGGVLFKPSKVIELIGPYVATFTDQAAWVSCSPCSLPAPVLEALTVRFVTDTSTSYEGSNGGGVGTSSTTPKTTTTQPKSTTTQPKSTTTEPKSTTTQPKSTTTEPKSTTTQPKSTNTQPKSTTTSQSKSTTISQPQSTTVSQPKSTTTQPKSTSATPASSSAGQSSQSPKPSTTATAAPGSQSHSQSSSPASASAQSSNSPQSQSQGSSAAGGGSTQSTPSQNSQTNGPSSESSPSSDVYTIVTQAGSGLTTLTVTGTQVAVVVETIGQVYTTVVPGPSGSMTLTAVKPGASITGTAAALMYTTEIVGPQGSTRTVTAIQQLVSSTVGETVYTVVQTFSSGTYTMTVAGVEPANTSPSAGLQSDAVGRVEGRNLVLMGMMLLMSFAIGVAL